MENTQKNYKTPLYIRKAVKAYNDRKKNDIEFMEKLREKKKLYARKRREELKKQ